MRKRVVIISGAVVLAGVVSGLGGIWYLQAQAATPEATSTKVGNPKPLSMSESSASSIPMNQSDSGMSNAGNNASKSQNNTGNSLKVNDNPQNSSNNSNSSNSSSSAVSSTPTADELRQYETNYKTKDAAFFGDITTGDGETAVAGKTIVVDYRGWLTNGTIFDESYKTNKHFSFVLGKQQVIAGWEQGILGMKVGGKRRIIVPPAVGYGANANGPIPANSLLVFDVEMLAVQ